MNFKPSQQLFSHLSLVLGCLVGIIVLQSPKVSTWQATDSIDPNKVSQSLDRTRLNLLLAQKLPTFGFNNIWADWIFLRFIQYFGDEEVRDSTGYGLSANYFQALLNKDPLFTNIYNYLFVSVSLYAAEPEKAIALTEQSLKAMSPTAPADSFYIWRNKAIDEFLLLGDVPKAIESFETAADWADQSPHPDSQAAAEASRQTAAFLQQNPDSRLARAMGWSNIILRAVDDRSRDIAIQKVEEFGGQVTIENGAVKVFVPAEEPPSP